MSAGKRTRCAQSFASVLALLVVAPAAGGEGGEVRYQLAFLNATTRDAQVTHEGPGEDGDGASEVRLVALSRPQFTFPATGTSRTVSIRVKGAGDASARFVFAERAGAPSRTAECASALVVTPRGASVSFATGQQVVRVRLVLPYVRAPFVEASDLYPSSGPCDAATGALTRALVIT